MTFVIKVRGAIGCPKRAEFSCDDCGLFDETVSDTTASAPCPLCGADSSRVISAPLTRVNPIEAVKGKWEKPERKTYTDTRNIGEGQGLEEWQDDRKRVWEEKRRQDVYNFAREHNERVIGGD